MNKLNDSMLIPKSFTALEVVYADFVSLTQPALNIPSVGGNPVLMTAENTRALFESLMT